MLHCSPRPDTAPTGGETLATLDPASASPLLAVPLEVEELHGRCGIYTRIAMAEQILDEAGWTEASLDADDRLLEPACGDGVFVCAAARRLVRWSKTTEMPVPESLRDAIVAYELHPVEAERARRSVAACLVEEGMDPNDARSLAESWVRCGDFLLAENPGRFSHVAGNPPYARWSRVPAVLRHAYEAALGKDVARGDLFLPFLDRSIALLRIGGRLGFLCSDRWRFMAFAEGFRHNRLRDVRIIADRTVDASCVYQRAVDIYPSVLVLERTERSSAPAVLTRKPLVDRGFRVRVGPALGCTDAFVLAAADAELVEAQVLQSWIRSADIREGAIDPSSRLVICMHDDAGRLREPETIPLTMAWLERVRARLEARAIVRVQNAPWYRPIDRVQAAAWAMPKLLVPELARVPRLALDESGGVPAHGVYAITADRPHACVADLADRLAEGGLARALQGSTPTVKGGYVRCYKKFLEAMEV